MRSIAAILIGLLLWVAATAQGAVTPDRVLNEGLDSAVVNGLDAMLRTWYSDRPALAAEMKEKLFPVTRNLGDIFDTEIVAIQPISRRVTRFYVAIYYTRCPLWLRVERYANGDKVFYLPLRFSTNPDDIMPGYVTEFFSPR